MGRRRKVECDESGGNGQIDESDESDENRVNEYE